MMSRAISSGYIGDRRVAGGANRLRFSMNRPNPTLTRHWGAVAPALPVQLIFWGAWWNGAGANQRTELEAKIKTLLASPYTAALAQYGIGQPTWHGSIIVTSPGPPASYNHGHIHDLVWDLIDDGKFPEPDEDGGRLGYFVMMPDGTTVSGEPGAHGYQSDYDFPFDIDYSWDAYVAHDATDSMTSVFSHELVEMCTDPEQDAWYSGALGTGVGEIGDVCQQNGWETAYVDGVNVMAYWSNEDNSCVIPGGAYGAEINGRIDVTSTTQLAQGDQTFESKVNPVLCAISGSCCLSGTYHWWRTQSAEQATLTVKPTGYKSPTYAWTLNGIALNGSGVLPVSVDVSREFVTGVQTVNQSVSVGYTVSGATLTVTNNAIDGAFEIDVAVTVGDSAVGLGGGTVQGLSKTARIRLDFEGDHFKWDDKYMSELEACRKAYDDYFWKTHQQRVFPSRPIRIDPGPRRELDRRILAALPASTPVAVRHQVRGVLSAAERVAEHAPEEAAELRELMLQQLRVRVR